VTAGLSLTQRELNAAAIIRSRGKTRSR